MLTIISLGKEYQAYEQSIGRLSMQINFEKIDFAKTSAFLCFTLNLGLPINTYRDLNAFPDNACLGAYIPANHEIVVTSDSAGITIMPFKDFKSNMDTHFAMNIAVTKKDYSQVLIYKSTLHFTTIFSDLILLSMRTPILTLTKAKLDGIVAKETEVLKKIKQVMSFIGLSTSRKRSLSDFIFGPNLSKSTFLYYIKSSNHVNCGT